MVSYLCYKESNISSVTLQIKWVNHIKNFDSTYKVDILKGLMKDFTSWKFSNNNWKEILFSQDSSNVLGCLLLTPVHSGVSLLVTHKGQGN